MANKRIQRKRTKGFKLPKGALCVDRTSRWGNKFRVEDYGAQEAVDRHAAFMQQIKNITPQRYRELVEPLIGHDLACYCALNDDEGNPIPCHADTLLALAAELEKEIKSGN